jgi:hypothetical protein
VAWGHLFRLLPLPANSAPFWSSEEEGVAAGADLVSPHSLHVAVFLGDVSILGILVSYPRILACFVLWVPLLAVCDLSLNSGADN